MPAENDAITNARATTSNFWGIRPGAPTGAPITGFHEKGEFYVDDDGEFFRCVASGTPGVWVQHLDAVNIIITKQLVWTLNGSLTVQEAADGFRFPIRSGTIDKIAVGVSERGNTGDLIFDIHKHSPPASPLVPGTQYNDMPGTTVYTTQANRPKLAGDTSAKNQNSLMLAIDPDILSFAEGEFFSIDLDAVNSSSRDAVLVMNVKLNPLAQ